jgi:hypothetical protein
MAPGTSGTLFCGGGEGGGMLLVLGCGVMPLAGGTPFGAAEPLSRGSLAGGKDASPGAFVTASEPARGGGSTEDDDGASGARGDGGTLEAHPPSTSISAHRTEESAVTL